MVEVLVSAHVQQHGMQLRAMLPAHATLRTVPWDDGKAPVPGPRRCAYVSLDVVRGGPDDPVDLPRFTGALARVPGLDWVHLGIAGSDSPWAQALLDRGVTLSTSSGANAQSVAHTAIAGLLAMARQVPQWLAQQQQRIWQPLEGALTPVDLQDQQLTLVGLGPIGQEIARLATALGLQVTALTRHPRPSPHCAQVLAYGALAQRLPTTDWLVLACPWSPLTHHLVDAGALARIKPGARLLNVGRGGTVDEVALAAALHSGHLAGAYCDVCTTEPLPPDSPLWTTPRLLLSPHIAGRGTRSQERATARFVHNLDRWLAHAPLANAVQRDLPAAA